MHDGGGVIAPRGQICMYSYVDIDNPARCGDLDPGNDESGQQTHIRTMGLSSC